MTNSLGIDLSLWDIFPLAWELAGEKIDFAFIKTSEGESEDPLFRPQWEAARGKILRGGYHFFRPSVSPTKAALRFASLLHSDPGELPPVIDLEEDDGRSDALDRAKTFLFVLTQVMNRKPIVYSNPSFLHAIGAQRIRFGLYTERWLRDFDLWLASYPLDNLPEEDRGEAIESILSGSRSISYPEKVAPWVEPPLFWQWTSRADPRWLLGYPAGGARSLDLSFFRGSREELFDRFGNPRGDLPGASSDLRYRLTPRYTSGIKVRGDHDRRSKQVGILPARKYAFGDRKWIAPKSGDGVLIGDIWIHIFEIDGKKIDGWLAYKFLGKQLAEIDIIKEEE